MTICVCVGGGLNTNMVTLKIQYTHSTQDRLLLNTILYHIRLLQYYMILYCTYVQIIHSHIHSTSNYFNYGYNLHVIYNCIDISCDRFSLKQIMVSHYHMGVHTY